MDSYFLWESEREQWYRPNKLAYTRNPLAAGVYSKAEAEGICHHSRCLVQMHAVDSAFVRIKNKNYLEGLKAMIESLTEELNPTQLDLLFKELIVVSEERFRKNLMIDALLGGALKS